MEERAGRLAEIGGRYGADKCMSHSYLPVYEEMIAPLTLGMGSGKTNSLLEIGVLHGNSLKMWAEWLPRWWGVVGIDVVLPLGINDPRIAVRRCSQDDKAKLDELFGEWSLDVIIDDGSHRLTHQLCSLHYLWGKLRPGGLYFVEDVQDVTYFDCFKMMPGFQSWDLREKSGRYDDLLVMMRKEQAV